MGDYRDWSITEIEITSELKLLKNNRKGTFVSEFLEESFHVSMIAKKKNNNNKNRFVIYSKGCVLNRNPSLRVNIDTVNFGYLVLAMLIGKLKGNYASPIHFGVLGKSRLENYLQRPFLVYVNTLRLETDLIDL